MPRRNYCMRCGGLGTIWAPDREFTWLKRHNPITTVAAEGRHYVRCPVCSERKVR